MARQDEIIRYIYEVTGREDLAAVAKELLETGKASGKSAEQLDAVAKAFNELADEISDTRAATDALQAYERLAAGQEELASATERAGLRLKLAAEQEQAAAKALSDRSEALRAARAAQEEYAQTADKTVEGARELADNVREATAAQRGANKEWKDAGRASKEAARDYETASNAQGKLVMEMEGLGKVIRKAGVDTRDLGKAEAELARSADEAGRKLVELARSSQRSTAFGDTLRRASERAGNAMRQLRDQVTQLGGRLLRITGIAGGVTAALGALSGIRMFQGAARSATEFGAALSEVQAIAGASAEKLAEMRAAAEAVASGTKFSALEAVQGLSELVRATGDADAAMAMLTPTMNLAQGAAYGVAESATLVTTTLTQFGMAASEAGRVSDVLAEAANNTNANVEGLGNALSYAAPLARQLGWDLEETTAVIGALADEGFRGTRAGTALRNVLGSLLDPSSKFKQALVGLGIETNDFAEIMQGLAAAGDRGREALMQIDSAARPAILALASSGGAAIRDLSAALREAEGSAAGVAAVMGDNFDGARRRLGNALDSMRRALVDPILEPLKTQFDDIAVSIRNFMQTAQFDQIKTALADFAASGVRAMREFIASVDFAAIVRNIGEFKAKFDDIFGTMQERLSAVGRAFEVTAGVIGVAWHGLKANILSVGYVATYVFAGVVKAAEMAVTAVGHLTHSMASFEPILAPLRQQLEELDYVIDGLKETSIEIGDDFYRSWDKIIGATQDATVAVEAVNPALQKLADQSGMTVEALQQLVDGFDDLDPAMQAFIGPALRAAGLIKDVGDASEDAARSTDNMADAVERAERALQDALEHQESLKNSTRGTAEAMDAAAAAVEKARQELADLTGESAASVQAAAELKNAFNALGIETQQSLVDTATASVVSFERIVDAQKQGLASTEDVSRAYEVMAQRMRAAAEQSSDATKKQVEEQLALARSTSGLAETFDKSAKAAEESAERTAASMERVRSEVQQTAVATSSLADTAGAVGQQAGDSGAIMADLMQQYAAYINDLAGQGEQAIAMYDRALQQLYTRYGPGSTGVGIGSFLQAMADAHELVVEKIDHQRAKMDNVIYAYDQLTDAALASSSAAAGGAEHYISNLQAMADAAKEGRSQFDLLNAQDLAPLAAAADRVAQRVQRITDAAKAAQQQLADMADALRDQIDGIEGDQEAIEKRRHQRQMEQLRELHEAAGKLGSSEYSTATRQAEQLHRLKMQQLREQAAAAESAASAAPAPDRPPASKPKPQRNDQAAAQSAGGALGTININLGDMQFRMPGNADTLATTRKVVEELMRQMQLSGRNGRF